MMSFFKISCPVVCLAMVLQLGGCATPATSQAMTVKPAAVAALNPKLKGALRVGEVGGGKDTNPLWTSQVDNAGFKKALMDSLAITGYLAQDPVQARYSVDATLVSLDQPVFGLTYDVKSEVNYKLTGPARTQSFPVRATGTATTGDAFVGVERLRIANERSIMENIKEFIQQLVSLVD
jgi:hypothetical protein